MDLGAEKLEPERLVDVLLEYGKRYLRKAVDEIEACEGERENHGERGNPRMSQQLAQTLHGLRG